MTDQEIKEKLAKAVGYQHFPNDIQINKWLKPDGNLSNPNDWVRCPPDFPNDMNACLKWIVPILEKQGQMVRIQWGQHYGDDMKYSAEYTAYASIYDFTHKNKRFEQWAISNKSMPRAFCLAALKYFEESGL